MKIQLLASYMDPRFKNGLPATEKARAIEYLHEFIEYPIIKKQLSQ